MKYLSLFLILLAATLTVKLSYDPKRGYSYTITGGSPEEVIDAELKLKNYIRKGKVPPLPKKEQTN
ncbi:MAG: hypothetical protein OHK0040_06270 [bacterium]